MSIVNLGYTQNVSLAAGESLTVTSYGDAVVTAVSGGVGSGVLGTVDGTSTFGPYSSAGVISIQAKKVDCSYQINPIVPAFLNASSTALLGPGGLPLEGLVLNQISSFLFSGSTTTAIAGLSAAISPKNGQNNTATVTTNTGVTACTVAIQAATDVALTNWVTLGTMIVASATTSSFSFSIPYYGYRANVIAITGGTCSVALTAGIHAQQSSTATTNPVYTGNAVSAPYIVGQSAVPVLNPPSGSVAANGALTLGTATYIVYPNLWVYLPAGAAYAASAAGFYYCVMTSTTVGTIYNTVLGATQQPYIPASPTAIGAAGPGAFVAITSGPVYVCLAVVPGGSIGANGALRVAANFGLNGGSTSSGVLFGGNGAGGLVIHSNASGALANAGYDFSIRNRGITNAQLATPQVQYADTGAFNAAPQVFAIDTLTTQYVSVQLYVGAGTMWSSLEGYTVEVLPG